MVVEKSEFEARKKELLKKKKKNRLKRRFIVFVFLFICAAVIFTVLKAPLFNIKTIICVGQETLTEEQVIQIAGVKTDANIFSTGVKAMKRRLADEPLIAECNVRRLFPNKLKIWIREAKTAAYVEGSAGIIHIRETGQIIRITDPKEEKPKAAHLLNFTPASEILGENVIAEDNAADKIILECIGLLNDLEMLEKVTSISVADLSDIRIDYEDRLYILLGSYESMEYKLTFVKKVISENLSEYEKALLDYRGQNLYVGPRENPDEKPEETETPEEKTADGEKTETQDAENTEKPEEKNEETQSE